MYIVYLRKQLRIFWKERDHKQVNHITCKFVCPPSVQLTFYSFACKHPYANHFLSIVSTYFTYNEQNKMQAIDFLHSNYWNNAQYAYLDMTQAYRRHISSRNWWQITKKIQLDVQRFFFCVKLQRDNCRWPAQANTINESWWIVPSVVIPVHCISNESAKLRCTIVHM